MSALAVVLLIELYRIETNLFIINLISSKLLIELYRIETCNQSKEDNSRCRLLIELYRIETGERGGAAQPHGWLLIELYRIETRFIKTFDWRKKDF